MRKRNGDGTRARFSDALVVAKPEKCVDLRVTIDRAGADYAVGAAARRA